MRRLRQQARIRTPEVNHAYPVATDNIAPSDVIRFPNRRRPRATEPVLLDDSSDAGDIRRAWGIETSPPGVKYRDMPNYRDPDYYLVNDKRLKEAPRTAAQIHFALNSFTILPDSHAILAEHAEVLREQPASVVLIAGHTDSSGNELYNLGLSYKRAEAVKNFLIERQGLAPSRLRVKPYGESQPIANNDSAAGQALNRRVEFLYLGEGG